MVAIDRCAGLVERCRELQAKADLTNVTFVQGDYNQEDAGGPFDVVVLLQGMPIYFIPYIPAESPESYSRRESLDVLAADPVLPSRRISQALASVARLAREGGHAVLHERLPEVSRALLFVRLACEAGLRVTEMRPVEWEGATEYLDGPQASPLMLAQRLDRPVDFEESPVIEFSLPRPDGLAPLAPRRDLCVKSAMRGGRHVHVHLGVAGNLAYVYTCSNWDTREMKVADARLARPLFGAAAEALARWKQSGEATATEPAPDELPALLNSLTGDIGTARRGK